MIDINTITDRLDQILQNDIEIKFGRKTIRKGTFILYTVKDFVLTIHLKTANARKQYDMFYPFDARIDKKSIVFDYTLDNLDCRNNNNLNNCLNVIGCIEGTNKFLDGQLSIDIV